MFSSNEIDQIPGKDVQAIAIGTRTCTASGAYIAVSLFGIQVFVNGVLRFDSKDIDQRMMIHRLLNDPLSVLLIIYFKKEADRSFSLDSIEENQDFDLAGISMDHTGLILAPHADASQLILTDNKRRPISIELGRLCSSANITTGEVVQCAM